MGEEDEDDVDGDKDEDTNQHEDEDNDKEEEEEEESGEKACRHDVGEHGAVLLLPLQEVVENLATGVEDTEILVKAAGLVRQDVVLA